MNDGKAGLESPVTLKETYGLPETETIGTWSGGLHLYYSHPGYEIKNKVGLMPGIDIRADGGY